VVSLRSGNTRCRRARKKYLVKKVMPLEAVQLLGAWQAIVRAVMFRWTAGCVCVNLSLRANQPRSAAAEVVARRGCSELKEGLYVAPDFSVRRLQQQTTNAQALTDGAVVKEVRLW